MLLLFLLAQGAQVSRLCFAAAGGTVPQEARQLLRLEESVDAMGSTYSVVIYGYDRNQMVAAMEAAFDEVRRIDHLLSNYRLNSELSEINRFAAERPVKVTPEVFRLLSKCIEISRESEGAFDISVGPLMKVWGFYRGRGRLPSKDEVAQALKKTGYQKIQLDAENRTVRFTEAGVELDPGGIGKGYAVDRMVEILKENGITSALVTAGGSSIYGLGDPNNGKGWEVKIRDPKNPRKTVAEVYLRNESLSTSGNYEKFFEAEGKIYSHIMDPRTGYPASGVLAVSVIAPKTLDSEAWTKPYFILGRQWAAKHKPKNFRVFICEDKAEQPCAWLQ
ncbi:MAG TPA: FAD:protein FMN transferase [Bryobacteraceae bacterium]|nr:FAD:protein FMN transferase [Bryobacteraceae bacterium]HOQ44111.1 FAD:protein FMN transferase [Bryobacteraceae bacterium]HPU70429.1 FAD:protein FMN transferase [Bryobacteraceae bacterium]